MNDYSTKEQQHKFYKSAAWHGKYGVRLKVLERDNYECQLCKREGRVHLDSVKVEGERKSIQLNVHHVKELEHHPELALDMDNLLTICLRHHNELHDRYQPKEKKWEDERW